MMKKKYLLVFHSLFVLSPWRVDLSHDICCTCAPQHTHHVFILVIIATEEMLKVNSPIRRNSCLLPTLSHIYRYHQMPQQREYGFAFSGSRTDHPVGHAQHHPISESVDIWKIQSKNANSFYVLMLQLVNMNAVNRKNNLWNVPIIFMLCTWELSTTTH